MLKHQIPIKTDNRDAKSPGWTEVDTVSLSGNSAEGLFGYTVNQTDILTTWVESRGILGKGEKAVVDALDEMAQSFPFFRINGIDSDNGLSSSTGTCSGIVSHTKYSPSGAARTKKTTMPTSSRKTSYGTSCQGGKRPGRIC